MPPLSPWPKSIFDADEEKSKLLTRLFKSNHPEDLQVANRLIKNLVKEVGISAVGAVDLAFDRADMIVCVDVC